MTTAIRALVFGLLALGLAAGCSDGGPKKMTVEGTVTYKGEPLRSGILRVVGDGAFATTPIRPDGTFTLTDVSPGEVRVGITEEPPSSSSSDGKGGPAARSAPLPAKYADPERSGLNYTIDENTRTLAIELR